MVHPDKLITGLVSSRLASYSLLVSRLTLYCPIVSYLVLSCLVFSYRVLSYWYLVLLCMSCMV